MNNKGFAFSGILYTLLLVFIVSMCMLLYNLQGRKTLLDRLKTDTVDAIEKDSDFDYLIDKINELQIEINQNKDSLIWKHLGGNYGIGPSKYVELPNKSTYNELSIYLNSNNGNSFRAVITMPTKVVYPDGYTYVIGSTGNQEMETVSARFTIDSNNHLYIESCVTSTSSDDIQACNNVAYDVYYR